MEARFSPRFVKISCIKRGTWHLQRVDSRPLYAAREIDRVPTRRRPISRRVKKVAGAMTNLIPARRCVRWKGNFPQSRAIESPAWICNKWVRRWRVTWWFWEWLCRSVYRPGPEIGHRALVTPPNPETVERRGGRCCCNSWIFVPESVCVHPEHTHHSLAIACVSSNIFVGFQIFMHKNFLVSIYKPQHNIFCKKINFIAPFRFI